MELFSDKRGTVVYTILWTPPRYPQLYGYLVVLALLVAVIAAKLALQLLQREKRYGQMPV